MAGRQQVDQSVRRGLKNSAKTIALATWLLSFLLAGYIFSQLPPTDFLQAIELLRMTDWATLLGINLAVLILLATRWLILIRALGLNISLLQILGVRQAGAMISFVTPGPQLGGEPLQVYWLWRRYLVPGPTAVLAVGLDRFFELFVNFSVLLVAVLMLVGYAATPEIDWVTITALLLVIVLLMIAAALTFVFRPTRLRRLIRRLIEQWQHHPRLRKLGDHWAAINNQLRELTARHHRALGFAILVSCLAWAGLIVEFWFLLRLAQVPLDVADFILLFALMRLAFLLPMPGGIGSVEAAFFWAFQALGLSLSMVASVVVLMRIRDLSLLLSGALVLPTLSPKPIDQ